VHRMYAGGAFDEGESVRAVYISREKWQSTPNGRFNAGGGAYKLFTSTGVFMRSTECKGFI
jgi:hypothetical protein